MSVDAVVGLEDLPPEGAQGPVYSGDPGAR
jgi:hypothetical protein